MSKRVILLLGPTQVGKSSLANFLVNGICDEQRNKFVVGDGTASCTAKPQCEDFEYVYQRMEDTPSEDKGKDETIKDTVPLPEGPVNLVTRSVDFSVIDSTGMEDTKCKDSEHVLELYKYLLQPGIEISCVVLVIKFPTLQDDTYKGIIGFYKQMLSSIFSKNVVVVITHAEMNNKKWIRQHARNGNGPKKVIEKMMHSFRDLLELDYDVPYFALNTLAHPEDDEDDFAHAVSCRGIILERCVELPSFRPAQLSFPKPRQWKSEDKQGIESLREKSRKLLGEIRSINAAAYSEQVSSLRKLINQLQRLINEYDSDDHVVIHSQDVKGERSFFWWVSVDFHIEVRHPIAKVLVVRGNIEKMTQNSKMASGTVKSDWFSALDCTITVLSLSRDVRALQIEEVKVQLAGARANLERLEEQFNMPDMDGKEQQALRKQLEDILQQIDELDVESLTYEQMLQRFNITS